MEFVIEAVLDLLFDCTLEASTSRRLPRWLRYVLIGFVGLCFLAFLGVIFLVGVLLWKESILGAVAVLVFGLAMSFLVIRKFRRVYIEKKEKW